MVFSCNYSNHAKDHSGDFVNYAKQVENVTRERTIKPSVFNLENSCSLHAITGQGVIYTLCQEDRGVAPMII